MAASLLRFFQKYKVTKDVGNISTPQEYRERLNEVLVSCLEQVGGKTFNDGIYRGYRWDQIARATQAVSNVFLATQGSIVVFAYDWLGRQFAVDSREQVDSQPTVKCFNFGAPSSFCTDQPIDVFHEKALTDEADAALAEEFYIAWKSLHSHPIPPDKCAGYKTPLFLSGEDWVDNLELTDLDVYLEITTQLWLSVKDLPPGTRVGQAGQAQISDP